MREILGIKSLTLSLEDSNTALFFLLAGATDRESDVVIRQVRQTTWPEVQRLFNTGLAGFWSMAVYLGAECLVFVSSRSLKTRKKYTNSYNLPYESPILGKLLNEFGYINEYGCHPVLGNLST